MQQNTINQIENWFKTAVPNPTVEYPQLLSELIEAIEVRKLNINNQEG